MLQFPVKFFPLLFLLFYVSCSQLPETIRTEQSLNSSHNDFNPDTVKALKFDTGKMWTFEFPPLEYFRDEYDFNPSQEWFDDVRLSAVKFGRWCSASFVSEDGLIMTNNHCSDFIMKDIQKEGEDFRTTGFIAKTLDDERSHPTLYVDQLVSIEDVTKEIQEAIASGKVEAEKSANKKSAIERVKESRSGDGLFYDVITMYNGGRYSLYGYKRYDDIRLVFIPETELGLFGGDPDNYTFPRYCLDVTFWRAYDDLGKPVKVSNYFRWSSDGAKKDELLFVIGNPGRTSKLKTVAQLEYMRDYPYKNNVFLYSESQKLYEELSKESPEARKQYSLSLSGIANVNKRYTGVLRGLRNPYYMARKKDFERQFRDAVMNNSLLKEKYDGLWEKIALTRSEMSRISDENAALSRSKLIYSDYYSIAEKLITLAEELKLPEERRSVQYSGTQIVNTIDNIFPAEFNKPFNDGKLKIQADLMHMIFGPEHLLVKKMFNGKKGEEAVRFALDNSLLTSKEEILSLVKEGPDEILNSGDPFIFFVLNTRDRFAELQVQVNEINETEEVYENQLGQALFEIYGTSIPPDGTSTLRLSDGILRSYEYNGTIAPLYTTFYGLYDRFHSFSQRFPWSLPERWKNPPAEFDLETPYNFISTHDIVGGSSGSAVININKEIVGLAFDGNIESNAGYFIYDTINNRMISVSSQGIFEAVSDLYDFKRLAEELKNGSIKK